MLITTMGISSWIGIASMAPTFDAQASYQDVNPTAEMRLALTSNVSSTYQHASPGLAVAGPAQSTNGEPKNWLYPDNPSSYAPLH